MKVTREQPTINEQQNKRNRKRKKLNIYICGEAIRTLTQKIRITLNYNNNNNKDVSAMGCHRAHSRRKSQPSTINHENRGRFSHTNRIQPIGNVLFAGPSTYTWAFVETLTIQNLGKIDRIRLEKSRNRP